MRVLPEAFMTIRLAGERYFSRTLEPKPAARALPAARTSVPPGRSTCTLPAEQAVAEAGGHGGAGAGAAGLRLAHAALEHAQAHVRVDRRSAGSPRSPGA